MYPLPPFSPQDQHVISDFEAKIAGLNHQEPGCRQQISLLRDELVAAHSAENMSMHNFRLLWEKVSVVQGKHALYLPDGWRFPRQEGVYLAYVPPPPVVTRR